MGKQEQVSPFAYTLCVPTYVSMQQPLVNHVHVRVSVAISVRTNDGVALASAVWNTKCACIPVYVPSCCHDSVWVKCWPALKGGWVVEGCDGIG